MIPPRFTIRELGHSAFEEDVAAKVVGANWFPEADLYVSHNVDKIPASFSKTLNS